MGAEDTSAAGSSQDDILCIGLDLGTSQSSIATSTGVRSTVTSVVGWPKDLISYKFLQKQVVIGDDCLENRMAVDMIWPLEHGVFRHRPAAESEEEGGASDEDDREAEAVQHLISYILELADPKPNQEIHAVIGCPARTTAEDRKALTDAIGHRVKYAMVASEPLSCGLRTRTV